MESDTKKFKVFLKEVQGIHTLVDQANALYSEMIAQKVFFLSTSSISNIESSTQIVKEISKKFQLVLDSVEKKVEALQKESSKEKDSTEYIHLAHIKGIIERAQKILLAFRKEEAQLLTESKEKLVKQYKIINPKATDKELSLLEDIDKGRKLLKKAFSIGNKEELEEIKVAEERNNSIISILEDLHSLNIAAERLNRCILRADETINTISYSVHSISQRSSLANEHLTSGIKYQKRRTKVKRILYFLLLFVLMLCFLYVFLNLLFPVIKTLLPK